jgi:hypothetical protein
MKRATRAAFNLEDDDLLRQKIEDEELGIGFFFLFFKSNSRRETFGVVFG